MKKTTLILVRHGESEANEKGIYVGQTDVNLTEKGYMQALATAEFLVKNYPISTVYSSDLKRAYRTGKAVCDILGLEIHVDKGLREIDGGEWENMHLDDLMRNYENAYGEWLDDIGNATCSGGESVRQMGERVLDAVTRIAQTHPGECVVIALHATPIRVLQCLWGGKTFDDMKDIPWVTNASATVATYENGIFQLEQIGIDAHLGNMRTIVPVNI